MPNSAARLAVNCACMRGSHIPPAPLPTSPNQRRAGVLTAYIHQGTSTTPGCKNEPNTASPAADAHDRCL